MSTTREEPPPEYVRVLKTSIAVINQRPFDADRQLQHGQDRTERQVPSGDRHLICPACQTLLNILTDLLLKEANAPIRPSNIALEHTLAELQRSARAGCHMCAILDASTLQYLLDGKPSAHQTEAQGQCERWLAVIITKDPTTNYCALTLKLMAHTFDDTGRAVKLAPRHETEADGQSEIVWIESTADDEAMQLATRWLQECQSSHPDCARPPSINRNVPKRLLELGDTTVRIVLNDGYKYACLSHCWGDQSHVPKQLSEDISNAVFDIETLPKTFQDAIQVTKRLGLRYLWIDCFCIAQGSREDWLDQSAVMDNIYLHSELTIAALASANVKQGCFRELVPTMMTPLYTDQAVIQHLNGAFFYSLEVNGMDQISSPLHTRGWVVQERVSAPRTIFFGELGLYWECRTVQVSQCHRRTDFEKHFHNQNRKLMLNDLYMKDVDSVSSDLTTFQRAWYEFLELYTGCNLTHHTDKLIAVSGLVNTMSANSGKRYTQGLWEDYITDDLTWVVITRPGSAATAKHTRPNQENSFPSWSWASMQGPIAHFTGNGRRSWNAEVTYSSDNSIIYIDTWIREVVINDDGYLDLKHSTVAKSFWDDGYNWFPDEPEADLAEQNLWIALAQRRITKESPLQETLGCLVLAAGNESAYTRVGMCLIRCTSTDEDPFKGQRTSIAVM